MQQLHPKSVWLFFFSFALSVILPLIFILFGFIMASQEGETVDVNRFLNLLQWLWLVVPVLLIIAFVWAKLSYRFYRYELSASGFKKESGVIYKKYVTIPYNRIQNVDINRGILARLLGLSDLHIQTAGASVSMGRYGAYGAGAEGRLPGLAKEVAEQVRDELINRARGATGQGL